MRLTTRDQGDSGVDPNGRSAGLSPATRCCPATALNLRQNHSVQPAPLRSAIRSKGLHWRMPCCDTTSMLRNNSLFTKRLRRAFTVLAVVVVGCRSNGDAPGVATAPVVRVADGNGNAVTGVMVRFSVTAGGGTVLGDSAVTDANGHASVGEWIMGTAPGTNTLSASVANSSIAKTITATAFAGAGASLRRSGQSGFLA